MADQKTLTEPSTQTTQRRSSRRGFLRTAGGVAAGTALFIAGCDGDSIPEDRDPTATLSASPQNPEVGQTVTFSIDFSDPDEGSGQDAFPDSVTSAKLNFGDGTAPADVLDGEDETHKYNSEGMYTATLIVKDQYSGEGQAMASVDVMVGEPQPLMIDFSDDFGVLNYAYALEQLEAAFYATVTANLDGDLSFDSDETEQYFRDVTAHEKIHRDFLKAAITANNGTPLRPIMASELDFGIDFTNADDVLATAQVLEDTGVSAYNGAAHLLENPAFLTIAGKIVSVEARHASAIRATIDPLSQNFADLDDLEPFGADSSNALDAIQDPGTVLSEASAGGFILTDLQASNLPG